MSYKMYQLLKASDRARNKDITTFKKWEDKKITLDEAIAEFRDNNFIDERVYIDRAIFQYWLNGLGYRRYGEG